MASSVNLGVLGKDFTSLELVQPEIDVEVREPSELPPAPDFM